MKNSKKNIEEVMREIMEPASGAGLKFFGNKALFAMEARDHVAEISIMTGGTHGHFPKLHVEIQSKERGPIACCSFVFEDYLMRDPAHRPNESSVKNMYVWQGMDGTYDWYICRPVSTKPIVDAIFAYIKMYS